MLDIELFVMINRNLNAEWSVRPSGSRVAEIPVKGHAITPILCDLSK